MNDEDILDKYDLLPKSNVPKKAMIESDELLSKYGLTPSEEVPVSKDQKWWQGLNADTSYEGVAKRFGIGIARGAKDVLDTGAHDLASATSYVANKILPENIASKISQNAEATKSEDIAGQKAITQEYENSPAFNIGRPVGQIAATLPIMPTSAMTGIATAAKALPTINAAGVKVVAPFVNRAIAASGQGALGGAIVGGATSSVNDKSLAENVGEGALTGAIAGPALTAATSVGKGISRTLLNSISPERAALAQKAAQHGIDLDASQVSESPLFKKYNQVSGWLPFSGAQKASDKQIGQFTKAVSNTFGENAENITPKVIQSAKKRIGSDYDTVAANTKINADNQLVQDLSKVYHQADLMLTPDQFKVFQKQLMNVTGKFANGEMPGEVWQGLRKTTEPLSSIANSNKNTTLGQSVKALKVAVDSAFNRSAPQDMQSLLNQANNQYKALKTIEKLANSSDEGQVSPLRLMQKVVANPYGGKLASGKLGELADIGKAFFPTPADSGTPLGEIVANKVGSAVATPISAGLAGVHALASGGFVLPTAEAAGGVVLNRVLRSSANSNVVKNAIIKKGLGSNYGFLDQAAEKAVPYSSLMLKKRENSNRLPIQSE